MKIIKPLLIGLSIILHLTSKILSVFDIDGFIFNLISYYLLLLICGILIYEGYKVSKFYTYILVGFFIRLLFMTQHWPFAGVMYIVDSIATLVFALLLVWDSKSEMDRGNGILYKILSLCLFFWTIMVFLSFNNTLYFLSDYAAYLKYAITVLSLTLLFNGKRLINGISGVLIFLSLVGIFKIINDTFGYFL